MMRYRDGKQSADSNEVTIEVVAPSGPDVELFNKYLAPSPELFSDGAVFDERRKVIEGLLEKYPGSHYLARPLIKISEQRLDEAIEFDRQNHVDPAQGRTARLIEQLDATNTRGGAFDEDRVLLVADSWARIGADVAARRAYEALLRTYHDTVLAARAQVSLANLKRRKPAVIIECGHEPRQGSQGPRQV
jgi:hypothetical protein